MTMAATTTVFVVDDDAAIREGLHQLLEGAGLAVESFTDGPSFLAAELAGRPGCVLLDMAMPGMTGHEVHAALKARGSPLPVLFLTGHGDVPSAVQAVQGGAVDFLEKPVSARQLLERVRRALELDAERRRADAHAADIRSRHARLSPREREVMALVVEGLSNKAIARRLDLSPRTVEAHRAHVMHKMAADSLADLVAQAAHCEPPEAGP